MNVLKIHPDRLFTKSAYSREFNLDRVTLDKRIKEGIVKTLQIKGATLVMVA